MYHDDYEEDRQTTTRRSFQDDSGIVPLIVWMIVGMAAMGAGFVVLFG